jgi:protocatechuate 3,4-dioxygenase beta subunit
MKVKAPSLAVAVTLLALPLLARDPSRVAPNDAPSSADVAPPSESGERLEVNGIVYAADGLTPVTSASVYVYQTDARGYYRPDDALGNRNPRLMALLRTDGQGRYSYRTIRPGSYPGTRVPQHIHYEVTAAGHGTRIFEIVFDDDPFVSPQIRADAARPGSIYALQRVRREPRGIRRLTQDVVLPER